jgi:cysteinyl-tRNA synthetase
MGKSLNNIYTLDDLEKHGIEPLAFRYLCLTTHFRTPLNFTWDSLKAAEQTWKGILNFMQKMQEVQKEGTKGKTEEIGKLIDETKKRFLQHVNDNLNTPQALADIHDMMKNVYKVQMEGELSSDDARDVIAAMNDFDKVLGILQVKEKALPIPRDEIERLIAERNEARKKKDFKRSDEIRDQLKAKGILLEDTGKGQSWKVA